ncbi:hypothetical protein ASZ90_019570 [hydrocarbon metagenome]|uniref:Smr domain-containing protein n=1 Tax=hydrocarbon metagenome TaxID=938273 RepID=A0A0W8E3X5_9ZZZZ
MKLEKVDLHGLSLDEALEKARGNLNWCIKNEVEVLDIIHGKGHHSSRNFSVIKKEIRKMLNEEPALKESGYRVVPGESDLPVALTFDEGHTLVVMRGLEKEHLGGKKQQEKNQRIYSNEGKKQRKEQKGINAEKRRKSR